MNARLALSVEECYGHPSHYQLWLQGVFSSLARPPRTLAFVHESYHPGGVHTPLLVVTVGHCHGSRGDGWLYSI